MKGLFYKLPSNFLACFAGMNLVWHMIAIGLTYVLVTSGFDWTYYQIFHHGLIFTLMFPGALLGFFFPIIVPVFFLFEGRHKPKAWNAGLATAQAAFLGWLISAIYKAFTGRMHPEVFVQSMTDISHGFRFGFFRGGIFWGWPSSHTAVAFALTICLLVLYPEPRKVKFVALLVAIYIGLAVSISIHWFSDFAAGAIIGSVAGVVVGKAFTKRNLSMNK